MRSFWTTLLNWIKTTFLGFLLSNGMRNWYCDIFQYWRHSGGARSSNSKNYLYISPNGFAGAWKIQSQENGVILFDRWSIFVRLSLINLAYIHITRRNGWSHSGKRERTPHYSHIRTNEARNTKQEVRILVDISNTSFHAKRYLDESIILLLLLFQNKYWVNAGAHYIGRWTLIRHSWWRGQRGGRDAWSSVPSRIGRTPDFLVMQTLSIRSSAPNRESSKSIYFNSWSFPNDGMGYSEQVQTRGYMSNGAIEQTVSSIISIPSPPNYKLDHVGRDGLVSATEHIALLEWQAKDNHYSSHPRNFENTPSLNMSIIYSIEEHTENGTKQVEVC